MNALQDARDEFGAWLGDESGSIPRNQLTESLDRLFAAGPEPDTLPAVRARLSDRLAQEWVRVAYYAEYRHPLVGSFFLAAGQGGLVALNFGLSEQDFINHVRALGFRPRSDGDQLSAAARQVREYLDGARDRFQLPVDLSHLTDFQRQVLQAAMSVPRGQVTTYGRIARKIGKPRAARAVGQALGRNPIPIVIPCHRVVAADGGLQGYSGGGGIETKARLLALEGAALPGR